MKLLSAFAVLSATLLAPAQARSSQSGERHDFSPDGHVRLTSSTFVPRWMSAPIMLAEEARVGSPFRECEQCPPIVRIPLEKPGGFRFAMVYELTWRNYLDAVDDGACLRPRMLTNSIHVDGMTAPQPYYSTNAAIEGVQASQLACYLDWIESKSGRRYRLPSGTEWLWLAYGGVDTAYPWGDDIGHNRALIRPYFDWERFEPYSTRTHWRARELARVVGQLEPNAFGLYDVIGNAWELTKDCETRDGRLGVCGFQKMHGGSAVGSGLRRDRIGRTPAWVGIDRSNADSLPTGNTGYRLIAD